MHPSSRDLIFREVTLESEDYSNRTVDEWISIESRFTRCRFAKIRAKAVKFAAGKQPSVYVECIFDGSKLSEISAGPARFERCSFEKVTIKGIRCHEAEFVNCTFSGRIEGGFFNGTPDPEWQSILKRSRNEFIGNDFLRADLRDIDFRTGIDLTLQQLPHDPSKYLICLNPEPKLDALHRRFLSCRDLERREQAFIVLESLRSEVRDGQAQLFICKDSMEPFDEQLMEEIYAVLAEDNGA
jgi:uncharacterized protein YjbI with pentapeptide repeats